MIVRAVAFRDVRRGDMVSESADCGWYEIARCESVNGGAEVRLHIIGGGMLVGAPGQLIGLFRRPCPQGTTREDILERVILLADVISETTKTGAELERCIAVLRVTLDDFELAKPMET